MRGCNRYAVLMANRCRAGFESPQGPAFALPGELDFGAAYFAFVQQLDLGAAELHHLGERNLVSADLAVRDLRLSARTPYSRGSETLAEPRP